MARSRERAYHNVPLDATFLGKRVSYSFVFALVFVSCLMFAFQVISQ